MDKYSGLAYAYDQIMDHVPYDKWVDDLEAVFKTFNKKPVRILDCACGTGAMTNRLAQMGYAVTGIDLSEDMLVLAQESAMEQELRVNYFLMDIREIALKDKFDAVISYFDGVNYLLDQADLKEFFEGVDRVLKPGGLLIFDITTAYKMETLLGRNTFAESHEDLAFIWENYYDEETRQLQFDMTVFLKADNEQFERYYESHNLKAHQISEIEEALPNSLKRIEAFDGDTISNVNGKSERILFVIEKQS